MIPSLYWNEASIIWECICTGFGINFLGIPVDYKHGMWHMYNISSLIWYILLNNSLNISPHAVPKSSSKRKKYSMPRHTQNRTEQNCAAINFFQILKFSFFCICVYVLLLWNRDFHFLSWKLQFHSYNLLRVATWKRYSSSMLSCCVEPKLSVGVTSIKSCTQWNFISKKLFKLW